MPQDVHVVAFIKIPLPRVASLGDINLFSQFFGQLPKAFSFHIYFLLILRMAATLKLTIIWWRRSVLSITQLVLVPVLVSVLVACGGGGGGGPVSSAQPVS